MVDQVELLPSGSFPERIWLIYDPEADDPISWSNSPNPYEKYGEAPTSAVEYTRTPTTPERSDG